MSDPPYVAVNRRRWNAGADEYQEPHAAQITEHDAHRRPGLGCVGIPESRLKVLGEVAGKDVLELGCGAAQWSIALARRGA